MKQTDYHRLSRGRGRGGEEAFIAHGSLQKLTGHEDEILILACENHSMLPISAIMETHVLFCAASYRMTCRGETKEPSEEKFHA